MGRTRLIRLRRAVRILIRGFHNHSPLWAYGDQPIRDRHIQSRSHRIPVRADTGSASSRSGAATVSVTSDLYPTYAASTATTWHRGPNDPRPTPPIYIPIMPPPTEGQPHPEHPIYIPVYPTHPIVIPPGTSPEEIAKKLKELVEFATGNLPTNPDETPTPM